MRLRTRERTGEMETGQQSEGESGTDIFAIGRMEAVFNWLGTTEDDDNDRFIMLAIGAAKNGAPIRKNHAGMLSKPDAIFRRASSVSNILYSEMCEDASLIFTVSLTHGAT